MDGCEEVETDAPVKKKKRNELTETVTPLKGVAYELQRKHWEKQLQPRKIRQEKNRETKKDKEEL